MSFVVQYYFLRTTKLAQSTFWYYFVLQSLHKVRPSTTSYYKACTKYVPVLLSTSYYKPCTKYFPVLLRTTKLAQSSSQYYFVLQSSRKLYVPVLLRITKLARSTSPYYFVLQSSHKVRPSTTSYYKACTKYFPVLLRTTKLAQSSSKIGILPHSTSTSCDRVAADYSKSEFFLSF